MRDFVETLRSELPKHGFTPSAASRAMNYDRSYLSRVLNYKQDPSATLAGALDGLLGTSKFSAMLADHRAAAEAASARVDPATVTAFRASLDSARLLDDALGSAAVAPSARLQLRQVSTLAREAHGPHRDALVSVAAGWGVFYGWVSTATGQWSAAASALTRASEWSAETGDATLASVAWSFRAYLATQRGHHAEALGLATAAARTTGAHPAQEVYTLLQRSRLYAELGERGECRPLLDQADAMMDAAEAEGEPPTPIYWNRRPFFQLHAGRTLLMLGDHGDAAELLASGLNGLPDDQAAAVWTQIGRAHV